MRRLALLALATASAALLYGACGAAPTAVTPAPAPAAAARADAPLAHALGAAAWDAPASPEDLGRPSCFRDVLALDKAPGLEGVRAAFARDLADDELTAVYLRERLIEIIGTDATRALEVIAWARSAPADAALLLAAVADSAAARAGEPRVAQALLEMTGDAHDARLRLAAVDALRTQPRLDAGGRAALQGIALASDDGDLSWRAARALGSVMNEHHGAAGNVDGYWDELEHIAATSGDPAVRAIALEGPLYSDPILPVAALDDLRAIMLGEPERDVRELAAFQMSLTEDPQAALEAYRQAFAQEYDECVRWAIVRFAVRAAGRDALPLLEHFARVDPAFVVDLEDFRAIFAAGYQDFEHVWLQKPERHACVVEEGLPHGDAHDEEG